MTVFQAVEVGMETCASMGEQVQRPWGETAPELCEGR